MSEDKRTTKELLAEIERLKGEQKEEKKDGLLAKAKESVKEMLSPEESKTATPVPKPGPIVDEEEDFVPVPKTYVYVKPVIWHPRFLLDNPPERMAKDAARHNYYLNCTEAEKQQMLEANASLTPGTTYPKYQGIYNNSTIATEYIIEGMKITLCLLVGNFPENFLAKEDVYVVTDQDIENAKIMTSKLSDKQKEAWTEEEQFRFCLKEITCKARSLKGV